MIRLWKWWSGQGYPCLFRRITGWYCPGCGGTRAVKYLLEGNIIKSLRSHPLIVYMAVIMGAEAVRYLLSAGKADRDREKYFSYYQAEVLAGAGLILANWFIKNWALAVMGVDLLP